MKICFNCRLIVKVEDHSVLTRINFVSQEHLLSLEVVPRVLLQALEDVALHSPLREDSLFLHVQQLLYGVVDELD